MSKKTLCYFWIAGSKLARVKQITTAKNLAFSKQHASIIINNRLSKVSSEKGELIHVHNNIPLALP
jgi:hypothetical protein